jgi:hypothetical protein
VSLNLNNFNVPGVPAAFGALTPAFASTEYTRTYSAASIGGTILLSQTSTEFNVPQDSVLLAIPAGSPDPPFTYETTVNAVLTAEVGTPVAGATLNGLTLDTAPITWLDGSVVQVIISIGTDFVNGLDGTVTEIYNASPGIIGVTDSLTDLDGNVNYYITSNSLAPGTPVFIGFTFSLTQTPQYNDFYTDATASGDPDHYSVTVPATLTIGSGFAAPALLAVMDGGIWRALGTAGNPVKVKQASGLWRTFDGSGSSPFQIRQADGSWVTVSSST